MAQAVLDRAAPLAEVLTLPAPARTRLPALREELRLLPAAANADGSPAWMVHDPVVNRFFRIGWLDFELLLRWSRCCAEELPAAVRAETTLSADAADVAALLQFLTQHNLLKADHGAAVERLRQQSARLKRTPLEWLLHNYLFFRIPLLRPQALLVKLLGWLHWIYTPATAVSVAALSVVGILLAGRQWDSFVTSFVDHLTWSGLVGYAVALVCAKTLHELGHALTATRFGVRVAHMGVAFLVMFPMLYTDTSESWKLTRSKQRLAIACAGIVTELALAGLATLAWSLAPEGSLKSALFFLAAVSWVMTLALNASPFMRFDGYFILSDLLDFPNLHERAGAMARARLRRGLLGLPEPDPERLPGRGNAWLAGFALVTWIYRLVVFLGIALLVYHYFFKLLGVVLMSVELIWFIARPVAQELRVWIARRAEIKTNRRVIAASALLILFAVLLLPWQGSVRAPGWMHAQRQQMLFSPLAGQLLTLPASGAVKAGQLLFVLTSPDLNLAGERAQHLADARERELVGLAGLPNGEERRTQVQTQRDRFTAEARLYAGESQRLRILAPFTGQLTDVDPQLAPDVWVQSRQPLAMLVDPSQWVVETFVAEADIGRVHPGQKVRISVNLLGFQVLSGKVLAVDTGRTTTLPHRLLDAQAGGPIVTLPSTADHHAETSIPRDSLYRVIVAVEHAPDGMQMALAKVSIATDSQAWLPNALKRFAAILMRESGF